MAANDIIIYRKSDQYAIQGPLDTALLWVHVPTVGIREHDATNLTITYDTNVGPQRSWKGTASEVLGEDGLAYGATNLKVIRGLNSGLDVNLQDQTTPAVITNFNNITNSTTLNGAIAIDDRDIIVTDATGATLGGYIVLFSVADIRFTPFEIVAINGTTLTLDSPSDFAYPDGTFVDIGTDEMSVDGSSTSVIFGMRGTGAPPGVELSVDITRIIFTCITDTAISSSLFGDLLVLLNGLVLRKRDGVYHNIFNVKNNRDLAGIAFDFTPSVATNPAQGEDGFQCRLTFGGQSKIGVVQRLNIGEDLELIIQDDLTGLTNLKCTAEGT